jgi:hypothetical protein
MQTLFLCLGGTGTQIGTAIGNIYPLLREAGICDDSSELSMFILDKDAYGGIFRACANAHDSYVNSMPLLPFSCLKPYEYKQDIYQELQEAAGFRNKNYTVMTLIGGENNGDPIKDLAAMCWTHDKQGEDMHEGNNRDPSRGSIDAEVCLSHFQVCGLYKKLESIKNGIGEANARIVILGGATGGMGSSLIVPLVRHIREYFTIKIDLVVLGTYFSIPALPKENSAVDNIGKSNDSFYRVADQLEELKDMVTNDWRVYYVALPETDDICGKFSKNGADKRKAHLVELCAALAAFELEGLDKGLYETVLSWSKEKHNGTGAQVGWSEVPCGAKLQKPVNDFMTLLSVLAGWVLPHLSGDENTVKKDAYLRPYLKPIKSQDYMGLITPARDMLKDWLKNYISFYEFWNEIQMYTKFGDKNNKTYLKFIPADKDSNVEDMQKLGAILTEKQLAFSARVPLYKKSLDNFVSVTEKEVKKHKNLQEMMSTPQGLLSLMIKDAYAAVLQGEDK